MCIRDRFGKKQDDNGKDPYSFHADESLSLIHIFSRFFELLEKERELPAAAAFFLFFKEGGRYRSAEFHAFSNMIREFRFSKRENSGIIKEENRRKFEC